MLVTTIAPFPFPEIYEIHKLISKEDCWSRSSPMKNSISDLIFRGLNKAISKDFRCLILSPLFIFYLLSVYQLTSLLNYILSLLNFFHFELQTVDHQNHMYISIISIRSWQMREIHLYCIHICTGSRLRTFRLSDFDLWPDPWHHNPPTDGKLMSWRNILYLFFNFLVTFHYDDVTEIYLPVNIIFQFLCSSITIQPFSIFNLSSWYQIHIDTIIQHWVLPERCNFARNIIIIQILSSKSGSIDRSLKKIEEKLRKYIQWILS